MADGAHVRLGGIDDAAALAALRWNWRVAEGEEPATDRAAFDADFAGWMAAHADTHLPFLAELDDRPVAMAWLAIIERVPGPGRWDRRAGFLQSVYVEPDVRDQGVGSALSAALIEHARAIGLDYVMVHPTERSMPYYRRLGFTEYDRALELRF